MLYVNSSQTGGLLPTSQGLCYPCSLNRRGGGRQQHDLRDPATAWDRKGVQLTSASIDLWRWCRLKHSKAAVLLCTPGSVLTPVHGWGEWASCCRPTKPSTWGICPLFPPPPGLPLNTCSEPQVAQTGEVFSISG